MAKIDLKFLDAQDKSWISCEIGTEGYSKNLIVIECGYQYITDDGNYIYLDKSTAIKFAKTLRTEINKIQ